MLYLMRFLLGTAKIRIEGDFPEKVLNYLAKNSIQFWHIYKNNGFLYFTIFKKDIGKIEAIEDVAYTVLNKSGFIFLISKYKLRLGFIVGIALFAASMLFLSGRIWDIEITGTEKVDNSVILEALKPLNIEVGKSKKFGDPDIVKQKLMLLVDGIAWASINTEGTTVTINISETIDNTENLPSNLVAEFDGIIKKIEVSNGNALVNIGDTVYKNQILVSGEMYSDGVFRKSIGKITADVTNQFTYEIPALTEKREYIKERHELSLSFLGIYIPLYLEKNSNSAEKQMEITEILLAGKKLPVKLYKKTLKEYKSEFFKTDEELAYRFAEEKLKEELNSKGIEFYNIFSKKNEDKGNSYLITFSVNFKTDIAKEEYLQKYNEK